jgi:ribosomal-protein-alanine N-acetyltransferase
LIVRPFTFSDLDGVTQIEQQWHQGQWSQGQLEEELFNHNSLVLVADENSVVVATLFFRCCVPEAELLRISVSEKRRGRKIGSVLLNKGLTCLVAEQIETCFLEVRVSNIPAQYLYISCGFKQCGKRPKYYKNPIEDALLMKANLLNS